jgi:hypothetical protein
MSRDVRMSELIEANPALEQQLRDWQAERHGRGENPFDWQAFRVVVSYMGASDPGDEPPSEFFWFTPSDGGSTTMKPAATSTATRTTNVPSARLVVPGQDRGAGGTGEPLTEVKYWR